MTVIDLYKNLEISKDFNIEFNNIQISRSLEDEKCDIDDIYDNIEDLDDSMYAREFVLYDCSKSIPFNKSDYKTQILSIHASLDNEYFINDVWTDGYEDGDFYLGLICYNYDNQCYVFYPNFDGFIYLTGLNKNILKDISDFLDVYNTKWIEYASENNIDTSLKNNKPTEKQQKYLDNFTKSLK